MMNGVSACVGVEPGGGARGRPARVMYLEPTMTASADVESMHWETVPDWSGVEAIPSEVAAGLSAIEPPAPAHPPPQARNKSGNTLLQLHCTSSLRGESPSSVQQLLL